MEDKSPLFIDVRREEEYKTGHLPEAINLSIEEYPDAVEEIINYVNSGKHVILYCYSSVRSAYVRSLLAARHNIHVDHLEGGMMLYQGPLE